MSCTHGLLLCLDQKSRVIYIIREILAFSSKEGAEILEITPNNFRQILTRARRKIRTFLAQKCGLVNPNNPCRCAKKVDFLIESGMIQPHHLRFTIPGKRNIELME